jgi:hypothetical protein
MPDPIELESASRYFVTAAWVVGAVTIAYAVGFLVSWLIHRVGRRSAVLRDVAVLTRRPVRATLMVVAASFALGRTSDASVGWRGWVDHMLNILLIASVTWVVASLVMVIERQAIARFAGGDAGLTDADRHWRKVRTQVTVLRRLIIAVVVVLGGAAALMTLPSFSDIGKTLFASAGVLTVVAGLAAQTSLGAAFAGIQIAFSDAIRVGDVVVLEEEWGRIEEITLTYVVVHVWDERRLVLPCTYFTTTPFQNWTRNATELLGTAEFDVDFSVPFDAMRAELNRILQANPLWDNRVGVLQVTDAVDGYVRIRMLVSASDAPSLFDLRCDVREGMVEWLQRAHPGALPRRRFESDRDRSVETKGGMRDVAEPQADSGLFSGSPEADRRSEKFEVPDDDHDALDRVLARVRYDGA